MSYMLTWTAGYSSTVRVVTSVHAMPVDDLIEHEFHDCPCGPSMEAVFRDDGSNGWLVVHNSLDGRELRQSTPERRSE